MSTIPTCAVRSTFRDSVGGEPIADATITARLSSYEIYEGFVVPRDIVAKSDENGEFVLNLFPNELGAVSSFYEIKLIAPTGKTLRTTAVVPNLTTVDLADISDVPPYEGKLNISIADMNAAIVATSEYKDLAQTASAAAVAAAVTTTSDRNVATQARVDAQAARDQAVPAAQTATTKAGEAIGAAATATAAESVVVSAKNEAVAARDEAVPAAATSIAQAGISITKAVEAATSATNADLSANLADARASAALAAGHTYTTDAQGLAVVVEGQMFLLKTADPQIFDTRTKVAGVAVPGPQFTVASSLDAANTKFQFDFAAPKNRYNPALAEDGFVYNNSNGVKTALNPGDPIGIVSGRIPVVEGFTYTISQPATERGFPGLLSCWNAGGGYLGLSSVVGANPVVVGMNVVNGPPGAGATGGYQTVTFTVPVGSGVAFVGISLLFLYVAHTTADFNRIRNAVQLEVGPAATSFAPYSVSKGVLKEDVLPTKSVRVNTAFDIEAQRNLYNKAGAQNGFVYNFNSGNPGAYADGMVTGYTPVVEGKTYVAWMGDPLGFNGGHQIFCRNAAGAYLGTFPQVGANPTPPIPPSAVAWVGNSQVTFTIPVGSGIAFVGFTTTYWTGHTVADFNNVVGSIQIEENVRTAYQPYSPGGRAVIKADSLPTVPTPPATTPTSLMSVTKAASSYYVRGLAWDDDYDLVKLVQFNNGNNLTVNGMGARQALKAVTDNATAWSSGTVLWASGDSAAPMNYNATYIGANHGANFVHAITAAGHGKVVQDVGSEWTDTGGVKWYIMKVVDANTLHVMSQNNAAYPLWSFSTTPPAGNVLTHSASATNTATINITASVLTQLWPCLKNQTATAYLNGKTAVTVDGTYSCDSFDIVNAYEITNPASVLVYVRSQVGGAVQPSYIASAVATDVRRTITYRYAENCSCVRIDGEQFLNPVTMGYLGGVQAEVLTFTGKKLWQYGPRVTPKSGWDLKAQADISGAFAQLNITSANWEDPDNPPDRIAQIVKSNEGVPEFGLCVGLVPTRSVGVPALRKTLVTDAFFISAAKKQYPKAVTVGPTPAGTYYEICAFDTFWRAAPNLKATVAAWYRDGNDVIVMADFHQNVSLEPLALPRHFIGRSVSVIDKTASATLHGNGVVTAGGILVSITGGYGYLVLKLS